MGVAFTCLLSVAALVALGLAMDRHYRQAFGRTPTRTVRRLCILAGVVLTLASPWPWVWQEGPTMGLVAWLFCGTPLAGVVVVGLFSVLAETRRG